MTARGVGCKVCGALAPMARYHTGKPRRLCLDCFAVYKRQYSREWRQRRRYQQQLAAYAEAAARR